MTFIPMLTPLQWTLLLLVPIAIVALYFLKLKRQPIEVPSTYLWSRTIEDLHVNSIWQRLRSSLLLLLQLLLIALLVIALLRPGWRGAKLSGERFIFLIDTSASMSATDVSPSRLEQAKRNICTVVDQLASDDVVMVISFSDVARVEQSFTNRHSLVKQRVNQIQATNRTSDVGEALRAAAGLANPGRSSEAGNINDYQVADPLPATLYLYTDGGFSAIPEFSLGNLEPEYIRVGSDQPANVAIVAFTAERNPEKPDQLQAYVRLENSGDSAIETTVSLYIDDALADAEDVTIPARTSRSPEAEGDEMPAEAASLPPDAQAPGVAGVDFKMDTVDSAVLRVEIDHKDHLPLDNQAFAAINVPRKARVLFVSPGNDVLKWALETGQVQEIADVSVAEPDVLSTDDHQQLAAAGYYDLIVYDQCTPEQMPQSNTLFIGNIPPGDQWTRSEVTNVPMVIDSDRVHPIMQFLEMGNVLILDGFAANAPTGGTALLDSDIGPLISIGPRQGFEDLAMGFEIYHTDENGALEPKTDWPKRRSFPVFIYNAVRYLGGVAGGSATPTIQPGTPIVLRTQSPVRELSVQSPDSRRTKVAREAQNAFVFSDTEGLGVYDVYEGDAKSASQRFVVNLFDSRESDLIPRDEIELGPEQITAKAGLEPARIETWKWILLAALAILIFEWYVYNKRVYF